MSNTNRLRVSEYRELCEGLTQHNDKFREVLLALDPKLQDKQLGLSEIEQVQNRLNHALLGVQLLHHPQPVPCPEVEVSAVVHLDSKELCLYGPAYEQRYSFDELDPKYVAFLQKQQVHENQKEILLSSIALYTSCKMLEDEMEVPDIQDIKMQTQPSKDVTISRQVLEHAFRNSMVLMNHMQEQIEKCGLAKTYGVNKDELIQHISTNMFEKAFVHSLRELEENSQDMVSNHEL